MIKKLWLIWCRTVDHRIGKTDEDEPDIPILTLRQAQFSLFLRTFIILVNSNDGILSLSYEEFRKILDYNHEEAEGIRVSRKHKQSYRLSGRDGKLKYTIAPSSYPVKIIESLNKILT